MDGEHNYCIRNLHFPCGTLYKQMYTIIHVSTHYLCSYIYFQILYGGRYQVGSGLTTGEELEQVHSIISKAGFTTKYKSSASKFQSNPYARRN